jgi:hypothetical protein
MLHAGLDLSRRWLDVCLLDDRGDLVGETAAPSDADGLRHLAERLQGRRVRAVIESMNGARFVHDALEEYGWDVVDVSLGLIDDLDRQIVALTSEIKLAVLAQGPDRRLAGLPKLRGAARLNPHRALRRSGALGGAPEHSSNVLRERLPGGRRKRLERAIDVLGNVADLQEDPMRGANRSMRDACTDAAELACCGPALRVARLTPPPVTSLACGSRGASGARPGVLGRAHHLALVL